MNCTCIKGVRMHEIGEVAFTEGKVYEVKNDPDGIPYAIDDRGDGHYLALENEDLTNEWFVEHFKKNCTHKDENGEWTVDIDGESEVCTQCGLIGD